MKYSAVAILLLTSATQMSLADEVSPSNGWTTPESGQGSRAVDDAPPAPETVVVVTPKVPDPASAPIDRVGDWLTEEGFTLRRSLAPEADTKPATFSYVRDMVGDEDVLMADFALKWRSTGRLSGRTFLAPFAFVEGHLTSADTKLDDAWLFGAGAEGDVYTGPLGAENSALGFSGLYGQIFARYETDQEFDVGKLTAEANVTPTWAAIGMGQALPQPVLQDGHLVPQSPVSFVWQPTLGTTLGYTNEAASSTEREDFIWRLHARLHAHLLLDFLTVFLHGPQGLYEGDGIFGSYASFLFADWRIYYMPEEDDTTHTYGEFGLHIPLAKHVGVDFVYTSGENVPKFLYAESFEVSLAVHF